MSLKLYTPIKLRRSNCVYRLFGAAAFAHHRQSVKVIADSFEATQWPQTVWLRSVANRITLQNLVGTLLAMLFSLCYRQLIFNQ